MDTGKEDGLAMLRAIEAGDIAALRRILAAGYPVDAPLGNSGRTPALSQAAKWGVVEACLVLLAAGACVDGVEGHWPRPLHDAAANGSVRLCEILIAAGAKVDSLSSDGTTPLHRAVARDNIDVIRLLLSRGADVNLASRYGDTALRSAVSYEAALELLNAGADPRHVNISNQMHYTVFQTLVLAGEVGAVRACVDHTDIDLKQKTKMGKSLLALASGHPEMGALFRSAASVRKIEATLKAPESRGVDDAPRVKCSAGPSAL